MFPHHHYDSIVVAVPMSTLSITAPRFTDEELELEEKTYTEEEIAAAEADLHGTHPPMAEEISEKALELFRQALEDIPLEEKDGYLECLEKAPILLQTESNPVMFLQADNKNAVEAAERFVNYWELRRWLLGERAWFPLTATGSGGLSPTDAELLHSGFCTLLPQDDIHGRGILCFQVPPEKLTADRLSIARVTFYMLSLAMWTRPTVARNGLVVLADMRQHDLARYDRKLINCIAYLCTWDPVTIRAYHIVCPPGSKSCLNLVLPSIRYFMTRHSRQRFRVHRGMAAQFILDLKEYGIAQTSLPDTMGGCFTKDQFLDWLKDYVIPQELEKEEEFLDTLELDVNESLYMSNHEIVVGNESDLEDASLSPTSDVTFNLKNGT